MWAPGALGRVGRCAQQGSRHCQQGRSGLCCPAGLGCATVQEFSQTQYQWLQKQPGIGHPPCPQALRVAHAGLVPDGGGGTTSRPLQFWSNLGLLPACLSLLSALCPAHPKPRAHLCSPPAPALLLGRASSSPIMSRCPVTSLCHCGLLSLRVQTGAQALGLPALIRSQPNGSASITGTGGLC